MSRDPALSGRRGVVGGAVHEEHVVGVGGEDLHHLGAAHRDLVLLDRPVVAEDPPLGDASLDLLDDKQSVQTIG